MYSKFIESIYFKPSIFLMIAAVLSLSFTTVENQTVVLPSGTQILLENIDEIESTIITTGQIVDFRVVYDVKVNQKVVIKAGTIAKGQVIRVQKAGAIGRPGRIDIAVKNVTAVDGQEIYLTGGNFSEQGDDKQTLSIILGVALCIFCLFIKGKDAVIAPGTQVNATVASEVGIAVN